MSTGNETPIRDSSYRVNRLMKRVRTEVSVREVATFGFGKAWSIVLIVAAVFFVIAEKWAAAARHPGPRATD